MPDEIRVTRKSVPPATTPAGEYAGNGADPSLGNLFKRLTEDGRSLVQQEIALVKTEVVESAKNLAKGGVLIGLGAGMLLVGLLVLVAFAVVGLGALLGNYWLSSLIVGGLLALLGGILVLAGRKGMKSDGLAPHETVESLREDKEWAQEELRDIKRDFGT